MSAASLHVLICARSSALPLQRQHEAGVQHVPLRECKAGAHTCWCCRTLRLFIVRTMAASMACRLSWSTFSITFRLSSVGGAGSCTIALPILLAHLFYRPHTLPAQSCHGTTLHCSGRMPFTSAKAGKQSQPRVMPDATQQDVSQHLGGGRGAPGCGACGR